uniref:Protein max n=1 Tax=Canis lupus familiaris TaxID=9615 RepID=A0A8C0P4B5_CANLF
AASYSPRASTLSPGPGARRSDSAGLLEPQLPPRVLSSQQPPLQASGRKPPDNSRSADYNSQQTPLRFALRPPPQDTQALWAPSAGWTGDGRVQLLLGFVVFPEPAGPSVKGKTTTSLGGPSVTDRVTWQGADRACVPPLIRCCSEEADKRAHHNALERKRRDHIKDSFHSLRDSVPSLQGEKASRAQILDKATEYIQYMRRKNHTHQQDIDDLKRQNALLEQQGGLPAVGVTPGIRCLKREVLGLECAVGKRELIKFFVPGEFTSLPPSWKMQVKGNASNHLVRALEKARSSAQLQTNYPSSDNSLISLSFSYSVPGIR